MGADICETVEIPAAGEHRWTVLWLHGLGADGHDFEPIVPELRLPEGHGARFVFPHAPQRPVTINGGVRMRAWYDIAGFDMTAREDEAGLLDATRRVEALLARENERGVADERIVLAGFSQGGAVALFAGLRHAARLAGIVALSAYLPFASRLAGEIARENRDTPVFQAHGDQDPIVPLALARGSWEHLAGLRPAPEWHSYAMAHGVCAEEIDDLRTWLVDTVGID